MTEVKRITYVWALLSAITIGTWWLGHASDAPDESTRTIVTLAALAIAAVKVQLIVGHFMEVRRAPVWLRAATTGWLAALMALILVIYLW